MKGIAAGRLNERVEIQTAPGTDDGAGGQTGSWSTVATVWAEVRPLLGEQRLLAGAMQGVTAYRVTIRYRTGVTIANRLMWRGAPLRIAAEPVNPDMSRVALEIMCESGVPT